MTITLTIDSVDSLPDGGPIQFQARNRSFEIGRQQHLDWTLPDPSRFISGLHCDVRFEKGGYWLYDVSSNGTFLNGSTARMKSPYRLVSGDRLTIGHYIVLIQVEDGGAPAMAAQDEGEAFSPANPAYSTPVDDLWSTGEQAPPPIDRRELTPQPASRRREADFSQEFVEFPDMRPSAAPDPTPTPYSPPAADRNPFDEPYVAPVPRPAPAPNPAAIQSRPVFQEEPAASPPPAPRPRPMPVGGESFGSGGPAQASMPAPQFAAEPVPAPAQPASYAAPSAADQQALARFIQGLASGAGVAPEVFGNRDPGEVGFEIGEYLRVSVEQLAQLLRARAAAKAMTKSSSRTMIGATDNNPLKFIPTAAEAIDVMFSRRRPGFLGAKGSLESGFADLKRHELATYTAMQKALARLLDELSPETITAKVGASAFSSKKSRSWELFVERWEAKSGPHDNGMLDVFFAYFAEAYDEANKKS